MAAKSSAARSGATSEKQRARPPHSGAAQAVDRHLPQVDQLIHERIRLGIVSALAVNDSLTFKDLKTLLQTTDGNLSIHARKLEQAGYIACSKSFDKRMPKTEYKLTTTGKKMFEKYLGHMEALIQAMREH
jgi:DNA-binding MarR family transcriptional regulator